MNRPALALLLAATLLLRAGAALADDEPPERRAAIWLKTPRTTVYVGEVVPLTLEIHYDKPWFDAHVTSLFRQPMDLPMRALVPGFLPTDGVDEVLAAVHPPVDLSFGRPSFALGDSVVHATSQGGWKRVGSGRSLTRSTVLLTRRFRITRAGPIPIAAPRLEFAWAERFETDLLGVRTPVAPQRVNIEGSAFTLTALPLPVEGRPADFQGLIGRYTLTASADRTRVEAGEPLRLTVRIAGEGNHETLPLPGFQGLEAFHLLGTLDEQGQTGRTLRIDLAPLDPGTREIPRLELAFFDPERRAYDVARSAALRLEVSPAAAAVPTPSAASPSSSGEAQGPTGLSPWLLALVIALPLLLVLVLLLRRRRRAPAPSPTAGRLAALERLRALTSVGDPASGAALVEVLALHLGVPVAAVVTPDLAARLEASGLAPALAVRVAAAVEGIVGARYAGPRAAPTAVAPSLAAELDLALRPRRPS